ncbi:MULTISPECIES: hypothetical protein [unclassified Paenibacillus]|uniref:hypothetical protein n=1 Tax=unclassified Paenibacillus TaxID=185978 RepID=UPI0003E27D27|nr:MULTISPECIES: hypothetical protein [unclassified Paenibacillus]ETT48698.1 hypothetical protein C162_13783 [Paenibacillus sp. FSL R7-269]
MSWEPVGFMFFSTIETLALYYLIMSLYRFKWRWYIWQVLFVILLNNLQSYLLRNELGMSNVAPLVLILIFIMFFTAVVRMPLVLSIIATISGYAMFAVIQTIIVLLVFGSISNITGVAEGYFLQLMTAVVVFAAFSYIYRKGKGFTFDLDKLRFKLEDILLSVLIFGFVIGVSVLLYYNDILLNVLIFLVMSAFLLYYSTRKEREDA